MNNGPRKRRWCSTCPDAMYLLYDIIFTLCLLVSVPVLLARMAFRRKYRESFFAKVGIWPTKLRRRIRRLDRPIWIHALSVGELISAISLVRILHSEHPDIPLVVSTSTETGQALARSRLEGIAGGVFYAPLDARPVLNSVVRRIRPRMFLLVETDLWPCLLDVLNKTNVPSAFVNVRISTRSMNRYRHIRPMMRRILHTFSFIGAQTERDARRLEHIGAPVSRVQVTGNLKFDMRPAPLSDKERRAFAENLGWIYGAQPIIVSGSTHAGEERLLFRALARLRESFPNLVMLVAPRDRERFDVVHKLAVGMGFDTVLSSSKPKDPHTVVVLDVFGQLSHAYAIASAAFVGGSLVPQGGHNLLEPAAQGIPVLFGPHTEDFRDMAEEMENEGAGWRVMHETHLVQALETLLKDSSLRSELGERGIRFCARNRGAVEKTLHHIGALP